LLSRAGGDEYVDKESEFLRRIIPGLEPDSRTINDTVPVLVSDPQDWYERSLHKKTLVVLEAALDFVKFAYIPEAMLISEGGILTTLQLPLLPTAICLSTCGPVVSLQRAEATMVGALILYLWPLMTHSTSNARSCAMGSHRC